MTAEVTELKTLFWLSLSALPACWDPLLSWLGTVWVCVCASMCVCVCMDISLCVCVYVSSVFVCVVCVCVCTIFMCVGVCVGRMLKLTVSRHPEDIFMKFLTVDANQWILTWCSLSTLSCKTHKTATFFLIWVMQKVGYGGKWEEAQIRVCHCCCQVILSW